MRAIVLRTAIAVVGGALGGTAASFLLERGWLVGPNNVLYLTVLGLLVGYLVGGRPAEAGTRALDRALRAVRPRCRPRPCSPPAPARPWRS